MRGAVKIFEEIRRRNLQVAVTGIPKTVDNDIGIIDRSLGFQTAVELAQQAISAAHVEAQSSVNGIGLVKLMGRSTGHIALHATLSSRGVDCCLIPEMEFYLEGGGGLFPFLDRRMKENGRMVEDGAQEMVARTHPGELLTVKYIDPTYMIRAVPANATDNSYCTLLAHSAIHGVMTGYTGFVSGPHVMETYSYIPLKEVAEVKHEVTMKDHKWSWVRYVTNQPDFVRS